jgi:hypothetical protein
VDASLTLLDWPDSPDDGLVEAIFELIPAGRGRDAPVVLSTGDGAHLAWRGSLEGGVLCMYRTLDPVFRTRGLGAVYGSAALEVFVPAVGEVMALGGLRHVARAEWDDWVRCVERDEQLAARLGRPGSGSLTDVRRRWAGAPGRGARTGTPGSADRDALDFGLLAGCHLTLSEWYDPEGMLGEASASFRGPRHRTDFLAPGSEGVPGQELEESLTWRVAQWERLDGVAPSPLVASGLHWSDDGWQLRAWSPIDALEVRRLLPPSLGQWVARTTESAITTAQWLSAQTPRFAPLALSLAEQLRELDA